MMVNKYVQVFMTGTTGSELQYILTIV